MGYQKYPQAQELSRPPYLLMIFSRYAEFQQCLGLIYIQRRKGEHENSNNPEEWGNLAIDLKHGNETNGHNRPVP